MMQISNKRLSDNGESANINAGNLTNPGMFFNEISNLIKPGEPLPHNHILAGRKD